MGTRISHSTTTRKGAEEPHAAPTTAGVAVAWVVTDDSPLEARIRRVLADEPLGILRVEPTEWDRAGFWTPRPAAPALIILDVDGRPDWGEQAIQRARRARYTTPIVVITSDFSHEFGAKIVSLGVRYYFAHDFCPSELAEVARSLNLQRHSEPR